MADKPDHAERDQTAKRRTQRQSKKRDRTRSEILEAARAVVLDKGAGGATLEAVADAAGMSKTALYYYFPSKDAILFELVFDIMSGLSENIHDTVALQSDGTGALTGMISTTVGTFKNRLDDFRLAYLLGQVTKPGTVKIDAGQLEKVWPLNDLAYAGTANLLAADGPNRAGVDPRLMAFLAQTSALGVLMIKGMVESVDDPLIYADEQMVEALSAIFAAAAEPA